MAEASRDESGAWDRRTLDAVLALRRELEAEHFDERRWRLVCIRDDIENVTDGAAHRVVGRRRSITIELEE